MLIGDSGNQIELTTVPGFSSSGYVVLRSDEGDTEVVHYTQISGATLTGVTRGHFGTSAISFSAGADVFQGNVVAVTYDPDVLDTQGGYIHRGIVNRQVGLYDANEHLTNYEYYGNGTLKKTLYPDGTWEVYTYDGSGNMIRKDYGSGSAVSKTIKYEYDSNNRLLTTSGG